MPSFMPRNVGTLSSLCSLFFLKEKFAYLVPGRYMLYMSFFFPLNLLLFISYIVK